MQSKGKRLFSLPLLTLLLALTTVIAFAAREWVENGALIIYPGAENLMTQYDEVTVQYEYLFVEEPGVASAKLIGYTNDNCGGGNDRWGGVPVSVNFTHQATELEGVAKLVMTPDPALLTAAIKSVTVEIRMQETNHQLANRVDFYCRVVDHNATEAAAEAPEDVPPLDEILNNMPIVLNEVDPGFVLFGDEGYPHFGTLTTGASVTADISYKFKKVPGDFKVALVAAPDSCHAQFFQDGLIGDWDNWVPVSAETISQPDQMDNREIFNFTVDAIPAGYRSILIDTQIWENGERVQSWWGLTCFNIEDHTIDILNINPGLMLDEEAGWDQPIGTITPNATVTAGLSFTFENTPGNADLRLMGQDVPCEGWLYNQNASPIPTNSYAVSSTASQAFTALTNTASFTLAADQMHPSTKSVYLEARTFENGVETEQNVFLSCSNVVR